MNFLNRIYIYAVFWPLFWIVGIEQFIFYFLCFFEFLHLIFNSKTITINAPNILFFLLWLFTLPALMNVSSYLVYAKLNLTFFMLFIALVVIDNRVKIVSENVLDSYLKIFKTAIIYIALSALLYLIGLPQDKFRTLLGYCIGGTESFFINTLKYHSIGDIVDDENAGFGFRLMGLFSSYSSLTLISLLLLPICLRKDKNHIIIKLIIIVFYAAAIILTESRIGIAIACLMIVLYALLSRDFFNKLKPSHAKLVSLLLIVTILSLSAICINVFWSKIMYILLEHRATSASTRFIIYYDSIRMIPDKILTGYGHPIEIPGLKPIYSLGTHSSFLGILFQFGIFALITYIAILVYIWRTCIIKIFAITDINHRRLYVGLCIGFLGFNLREIADIWWWDTYVCFYYVLYVSLLLKFPTRSGIKSIRGITIKALG